MERAAPSRTELHRAPHRRTDATESADGSPVGLFSKKRKLIETLLPLTKRTSSWKPYELKLTYGSVRGASGDRRPYRDRSVPVQFPFSSPLRLVGDIHDRYLSRKKWRQAFSGDRKLGSPAY